MKPICFRAPLFFSLLSVVALGPAVASQAQESIPGPSRVTFSESLRKESKTTVESTLGGSTSQTETVTFDKWTLNAEMALTDSVRKGIGPESVFEIQAGSFEFKGTLKDDPDFSATKSSARLTLKQANPSGKSHTILVAAQLKWDNGKLNAKIEAKGFNVKSIAAEDFTENLSGDIKAETKATIQFGGQLVRLAVPVEGRVNRKTANAQSISGDVSGYAVTVNLKGDGKTS